MWESLLPIFTRSWWNTISHNHAFKPVCLAPFSWSSSFSAACLWSVSKLLVAIRWHLSYTSAAFLSLSAVFESLTHWQPDGPSGERVVPCVTFGFLKKTPETPNGRDQRKGESHLFFISCQRAISPSTGSSICLISLFVSPFLNFSFRHRTFWNRFLFFLLSQCIFEPTLSSK